MANQINTKIFIESLLCVSDIIESFETDTNSLVDKHDI